jgi:hypothetical protein
VLPINESEADSLGDAYKQFRKMRHLMKRVNVCPASEPAEDADVEDATPRPQAVSTA